MKTKGQIVRAWRIAAGFETAGQLAELVGTSRQNIENLEADSVDQPRYLPRLARLMGYATVEELLNLQDPPTNQEVPTGNPRAACYVVPGIQPIELKWGDIDMSKDLPAAFRVAAPDDAMAPRVRAGQLLGFETGLAPRTGDGVIVQAPGGEPHFRMYRTARGGTWEAYAENQPAFQTLTPALDGIEVVAVLVAIYARWG
jgi:transcriptional regulator with XRE-family HTH domain